MVFGEMRRRKTYTNGVLIAFGAAVVTFAPVFAATPIVSGPATGTVPAARLQTPAPNTAQYRVTMNIEWTAATHPGTVPGNAHVSPAIVAAHWTDGAMFVNGTLASPGIEAMAERGVTGTLVGELNATPGVVQVRTGTRIDDVGTNVFVVDLTQGIDKISLVTMLAPSPDWFSGFADRDMFVEGAWVEEVTFPLGNYDAGTENGNTFSTNNSATQPHQPISGPRDSTFITAAAQGPFGTVTITRIG